MKKKIAFSLLTAFLVLSSCSKDSGVSPTNTNATIDKSGNRLSTGASARDILSITDYDKLLIEIDYVSGYAPTDEAIANFEEFLLQRTYKETIEFKYTSLPSPNEESLTLEEVVDLETEHRDEYNDGSTLAIYIYFGDAPAESDEDEEGLVTLGAVYRNTSMIIYESTVQEMGNSSTAVTVADVETATLLHEFGHLFGLVNLSTESVNEHEDPDAENHCNVAGCLMRAELQFGSSLLKQMESRTSKGLASIPDFGEECLLDLKKYGGR